MCHTRSCSLSVENLKHEVLESPRNCINFILNCMLYPTLQLIHHSCSRFGAGQLSVFFKIFKCPMCSMCMSVQSNASVTVKATVHAIRLFCCQTRAIIDYT